MAFSASSLWSCCLRRSRPQPLAEVRAWNLGGLASGQSIGDQVFHLDAGDERVDAMTHFSSRSAPATFFFNAAHLCYLDVPQIECERPLHHMLSRGGRSRDRHKKYPPGSKKHPLHALRPRPERMPTPHPARHRAHALDPPQSWRPRRPRARGASLTLSSPIPARIPRSLTGPDCS